MMKILNKEPKNNSKPKSVESKPKKYIFDRAYMVLRCIHNKNKILDTYNDETEQLNSCSIILDKKTVQILYPNGNSEKLLIKHINLFELVEIRGIGYKKRVKIEKGAVKTASVQNYAPMGVF